MKCTQCQRRRSTSPSGDVSGFGTTGAKTSLKDRHLAQRDADQLINRRGNERTFSMMTPHSHPWSNSNPSPTPVLSHDRSISTNNTSEDNSINTSHQLNHHFSPSDSFYNDRNHLQQQTGQQQTTKTRTSDPVFMNFRTSVKPPAPLTPSRDLVASNFVPQPSLPSSPISSLVPKWSCLTCTYENWPRAVKCSMCYALKPNDSLESKRHSLLQSIDKLTLDGSPEVAEASGGFVIETNAKNTELASDASKSGFPSDSETENASSFETRKKNCNTSKK
jgi:hypothetical protein